MPSIYIPSSLRRLVTSRAQACCEYCLLAAEDAEFPHEIDHQVPIIHGGKSGSDNLVFACMKCNRYKGTNLAAFDPSDGSMRSSIRDCNSGVITSRSSATLSLV